MNEFSGLAQLINTGQSSDESINLIKGEGKIDELPIFLVKSLRQIIYRLKQAGMWDNDNDVILSIPSEQDVDFAFTWTRYILGINSKIQEKQMLDDKLITIDYVDVSLDERLTGIYPGYYYLVIHRMGQNQLIYWDDKLERWSFRAPWAMARFEVKD